MSRTKDARSLKPKAKAECKATFKSARRERPQNVYLREICISRLFCRVLLMMPKFELPSVPLGFPHCGVLKALNASHRNCSCRPVCTENDLASERSTTFSPGPTTGLRAELP